MLMLSSASLLVNPSHTVFQDSTWKLDIKHVKLFAHGSTRSVITVIGPQKFLSAHWLSWYFNNIFAQTLEDKAKNWPLLKEPWYSLHDNAPTNSCVDGFRTAEGRAILELCLRDMVQSADCPVVIAWDTEKEKVCLVYLNSMNAKYPRD